MDKLSYLPSQGTVRYTSDFNPAIGDTIKVWDACGFIAAATFFIPPQGVRLIVSSRAPVHENPDFRSTLFPRTCHRFPLYRTHR